MKKKRIGMVIAVEFEPFKAAYGDPKETIKDKGYEISCYEKENYELYVIPSGIGEVAAAASTQYLIDKYHVEMILNYGVVGGLSEKLGHALSCLVKEIVDYRFDTSAIDHVEIGRHIEFPSVVLTTDEALRKKALEVDPNILEVRCASGDIFVDDPAEKKKIRDQFGADICEMEAAGIYLTAHRNGVPALFFKVIADTLFGGAGEYQEKSRDAARDCVAILENVIANL
jgi:adenosylhomocysteine nucleosidase